MAPNSQKDAEWLGKRGTAIRVARSQTDLGGKHLTEQPGESWVTARAESGHEVNEQSEADQAVHRTFSSQECAGRKCEQGIKWLKGMLSSQERVKWPGR